MKFRFIFFFIIIPFILPAQNVLLEENKSWYNIQHNGLNGVPPYYRKTDILKLEGDTTIGAFTYYKLWQTKTEEDQVWERFGDIREDATHKVFIRHKGQNMDRLLYDFGVNIADVVFVYGYGLLVPQELNVTSIDSVEIEGVKRRRIQFDTPDVWIEGIGSLCGLLKSSSANSTTILYDLSCCFDSDEEIYHNSEYYRCFYDYYMGTEEFTYDNMKLYPNPVNDKLTVEFESLKEARIQLMTISGRQINSLSVKSGESIDVSSLPAGIYILNIISDKGSSIQKFCKN